MSNDRNVCIGISSDIAQIHSVHPCASRTAIIARRMSFHVSRFIITALGNMQPSQQMWRIRLVNWPLSSRSQ